MDSTSKDFREVKNRRTLILVRHVSAEPGEDGATDADRPLSSEGLDQIPALIESLRQYPVQRIYTSDTKRAAQTASEIGKALGLPALPVPALREVAANAGAKNGIEIKQTDQQESVQAFQDRISGSIDGILSECPEGCTVIVAHSGTIRATLRHLLRLPLTVYDVPSISQGGIVVLVNHDGQSWNSAG